MVELFQMWALVEVLGFLCLPLTLTIFKNLPDRGWAFAKIVGMALLAFCVWLPLMTLQFLPFNQWFILGVLLIILAFNIIGFPRTWKTFKELVREHRTYIITCELLYLGMIFLLGWIRSYDPNIQSFEMFMDEGFLASIMRSPHFPPQDMWLSGYSINYYYYAHYTIAVLAKLIGQPASVAFNTGICTFFGLTGLNVFGVTSNIVAWARRVSMRRRQAAGHPVSLRRTSLLAGAMPFGIVSVLMCVILGNLASTQVWWQTHDSGLPDFYWFNVSRVVPDTINEFPAFSFLLSCFHAHVLTLAFTILAVALVFNLFLERGNGNEDEADADEHEPRGLRIFGRGWRLPLNLVFMAVVIGGLFAMNGWDLPTYLGLAIVCIALQQWMAYHGRFCLELVLDVFTACASLTALSFFLYAPFYLNFISPAQGLGIVTPSERSSVSSEMLIYGTFMFIFVTLLFVNLLRDRVSPSEMSLAMRDDSGPAAFVSALASLPRRARRANATNGAVAHEVNDSGHLTPTRASSGKHSSPLDAASDHAHTTKGQAWAWQQTAIVSKSRVFTSERETVELAEEGSASEEESVGQANDAPAQSEPVSPLPPVHEPARSARPSWLSFRSVSQVVIIVAALLIYLLVKNSLWFVIAFMITALGAELVLYHVHDRPRAFTLLLGTVAFGLVALTEVIYLRDVFASSYPRMNTVFKFYFQAWMLLSITSGAGLYFILESFQITMKLDALQLWIRRSGQVIWSGLCLLLLLAGFIYPIAGSYQRSGEFMQRTNSLDGMAYLQQYDPGDYYAIRWLNANVQGDPVIVEAYSPQGGDYSYYGRVSAFTGLPTLMGWVGHEYQWRVNWLNNSYNAADFYQRGSDINLIYTSPNPQVVLDTLRRYQAKYLYVGSLEMATYPKANLSRFAKFMHVVYSYDGVTIYQVP
jgi:uncharacterized membrane protein